MITDIEEKFRQFVVVDPLPILAEPTYEFGKYDGNGDPLNNNEYKMVSVGKLNEDPYIAQEKLCTVPLFKFENIKQYEEMFLKVVEKAVKLTANLILCKKEDLPETLNEVIKFKIDGTTRNVSSVYNPNSEKSKVTYQSGFIRMNDKVEVGTTIYCFPEEEFTGVFPISGDGEFGLAIMIDSVCGVKII